MVRPWVVAPCSARVAEGMCCHCVIPGCRAAVGTSDPKLAVEWLLVCNGLLIQVLVPSSLPDTAGLGKDEEGVLSHVRVKRRGELEANLGLGASVDLAGGGGWSKTSAGFDDILASLNQQFAPDDETQKKLDKKAKKKAKKAKKKMTEGRLVGGFVNNYMQRHACVPPTNSRLRGFRFKKRLTNKDITNYSKNDIKCILGGNKAEDADDLLKEEKKRKKKKRKADDEEGEKKSKKAKKEKKKSKD